MNAMVVYANTRWHRTITTLTRDQQTLYAWFLFMYCEQSHIQIAAFLRVHRSTSYRLVDTGILWYNRNLFGFSRQASQLETFIRTDRRLR